jgi:hypothetical protein
MAALPSSMARVMLMIPEVMLETVAEEETE